VAGADDLDVGRKRRLLRPAIVAMALAAAALGVAIAELRDGADPVRDDALTVAGSEARAPDESLAVADPDAPPPGDALAIAASDAPLLERKRATPRPPPVMPGRSAMRRAWKYARRRGGLVSFAVVDTEGRMLTRQGGRLYASASVVKAMLLVAELRRLAEYGLPLDPGTEDVLEAMIAWSDNDAADAIYSRVGDPGLLAVAEAASMRRFTVAGYWGNAQVTAADLAHFFSRVRRLLPRAHRQAGLRLLASIVPSQRWGLPKAAARGSWSLYFKGGWRETDSGELVHQAGWLKDGNRELTIAVLTDAQPSRLYAIQTVRGIADRLVQDGRRTRPPRN
jgi:Beta-lactamase enzyme family